MSEYSILSTGSMGVAGSAGESDGVLWLKSFMSEINLFMGSEWLSSVNDRLRLSVEETRCRGTGDDEGERSRTRCFKFL